MPPEPGAGSPAERAAEILARIRAIPEGFVRTYGDINPHAPRLVGHVLATTRQDVPWHRVVRADGSVAKGRPQLDLLRKEGVPLRGGRVDLRLARVPEGLTGVTHPADTSRWRRQPIGGHRHPPPDGAIG